jgi:hypothetical protein
VLVRVSPPDGHSLSSGGWGRGMEAKLHACTQQRGTEEVGSRRALRLTTSGAFLKVTVNLGAWRLAGTVVGTMDGAGCYKFNCTS